jgi:hypothetical protein
MKLYINGVEAVKGQEVLTFRGEKAILEGWKEPYKPSSTGRVYIKEQDKEYTGEYFPSVIGGEFKEV